MGKTKFERFKGVRKRRKSVKIVNSKQVDDAIASEAVTRPTSPSSSSSKKFELFGLDLDKLIEMKELSHEQCMSSENEHYFLLVDKQSLSKLFSGLCCPNCKQQGIIFQIKDGYDMGFCSKAYTFCKFCEEVIDENFLSERAGTSDSTRSPFEINLRSTFAFMAIGSGYKAMRDWASMMNIKSCPSKKAYQSCKEKLLAGSIKTFSEISRNSVAAIRQKYAELGKFPDNDGVLDIAVSYDGTWQRRGGGGHSSHNGIGVVIEIITGLPIDYVVLSNFCHHGLQSPSSKDPQYLEWQETHKKKCSKNYSGSSNSMEQECAMIMWKRSVDKHKLRYTTMLSDGDSKAYDNIVEMKVYGDDANVQKEECLTTRRNRWVLH